MTEEIVEEGIERARQYTRPEWQLNTELLRETAGFAQGDVRALDYQWYRDTGRAFAVDVTFNGAEFLVMVDTNDPPEAVEDALLEVSGLDTAFETATAFMAAVDTALEA